MRRLDLYAAGQADQAEKQSGKGSPAEAEIQKAVSRQWGFHDCGQNQTSGCASVRSPSFSGLASRI
jgi:hypothetical protein